MAAGVRAHGRIGRSWAAAIALLGAGTILAAATPPHPLLLWNVSPSVPRGLYAVSAAGPMRRGETVVAHMPASFGALAAERGYVPARVPLVKRVAALPGDHVCALGRDLYIDGRLAATRQVSDGRGRPLPWWRGCGVLPEGSVLLLSGPADSFDGRYFGPIAQGDVVGSARLL